MIGARDSNEPALARLMCRVLRALQTDAKRVSALGKAWRLAVMVPVFGVYLIIARWRLWRGKPITVVTQVRCGAVMECRPPDLVMMYAHVFGVWEPDLSRFIARRLKPDDVFVDVGANVGYYSLLAADVVGDGGLVVSVEASPRIYELLRGNVERNPKLRNIRPVHVAAAAARGELAVHLGPEHNLGLTTTSAKLDEHCEATVAALPLHEILGDAEIERARLVKIDVEGGEDQVLIGMTEFLERCPATVEIIVELTPRWWSSGKKTVAELLQPFFEAGFCAYELGNNYWPWRYLWPGDVQRPQRVRFDLGGSIRRLDLVLSREDAEQL